MSRIISLRPFDRISSPDGNSMEAQLGLIVLLLDRAGKTSADLVCLPEDFLFQQDSAEEIDGPLCAMLSDKARQYKMNLSATLTLLDGGKKYNATIIFDRTGKIIGRYDKTHLTKREKEVFGLTPGESLPVFDLDIGRVGVMTCADVLFPEVARTLSLKGAKLILFPHQQAEPSLEFEEIMIRSRAQDNCVYIVCCSFAATGNREYYPNWIIGPNGMVIAEGDRGVGMSSADIDMNARVILSDYIEPGVVDLKEIVEKYRRPELYGKLSEQDSEQLTFMQLKSSNPAIITRIDFVAGNIPVSCHFSFGMQTVFPFVLMKISSGKLFGWGETLVGEGGWTNLEHICTALLGTDAREIDSELSAMIDIESSDRFIAEALSIAGYDVTAKSAEVPLRNLLGRPARDTIPLMPCIFPADPDDGAEKAATFIRQGFRHLKMKLVADVERDIATIEKIRETAPDDVILQGDANFGYSQTDIDEDILGSLKFAGLDIAEDPIDLPAKKYAELKSPKHPKLMLDIRARYDAQLEEFLAAGAIDIVNLHPCQQGLLSHALKRAELCDSYNVPAIVGGTGFTGVGSGAYQQLSTVIGLKGPCGELGGSYDHGMPENICTAVNYQNGNVILSQQAGHGMLPNIKILEQYVTNKKSYQL